MFDQLQFPETQITTFSQYADLLEEGAKKYPKHRKFADLTLNTKGECSVCARGALGANLAPEKTERWIQESREQLEYSADDCLATELFDIEIWTEQRHPLLKNYGITCQLCQQENFRNIGEFPYINVETALIHFFDYHGWSIQQIADLLRGLDQ